MLPDEILGEIQAPASHKLINGCFVVPTIPKENGTSWAQPAPSTFVFQIPDGTQEPNLVYMAEIDRAWLKDYSHSIPTGVYPGKMWKAYWQDDHGDWAWYLCWFDDSKEHPGVQCSVNHCPIILHEVIMLLNPGG